MAGRRRRRERDCDGEGKKEGVEAEGKTRCGGARERCERGEEEGEKEAEGEAG